MAGTGGGVTLGFLKFVLGLDGVAFEEGLNLSSKQLKAAQKDLAKTGAKIGDVGKTLSLGITAPFTALIASAIPAANESAAALAQVNAALTSMGGASGKTTEQLQAAAGQLQSISTFDDDDILKSVTANLLTFGNVAGATFDRAQLSIVNLSARLGTDLQSATLMVGKALNDPVQGITAMTRAGIKFTDTQKAQIAAMVASGNAAGAQAIILGELERQFGGAAAAARGASPTADMNEKWRTFQETVGALALKVLPPLTDLLTRVLNNFNQLSPGMQTAVIAGAALTAALGPLLIGVGAIVTSMGALLPLVLGAPAAFAAFGAVVTTTVIPSLTALGIASAPLLPWLAALAGAVALVYATWKNWPAIVTFVRDLVTGVQTWMVDKLGAIFNTVKAKIEAVKGWFFGMYDAVVGNSYVPDMVDGIQSEMQRLDGTMVSPAQDATIATANAFSNMAQEIGSSISNISNAIKGGDFLDILAAVADTVAAFVNKAGAASNGGGSEYGGERALGGPVVPGKTYLVGENGPEFMTPGARGFITPMNDNGGRGGSRVEVIPSPYFNVVVDGRAQAVAQPMVGAGMVQASQGAQVAMMRRGSRRLA